MPLRGSRNWFRYQEFNSDGADVCPEPFPKTDIPPQYSSWCAYHRAQETFSKLKKKIRSRKPGDHILGNCSCFFLLLFTAPGGGTQRSIRASRKTFERYRMVKKPSVWKLRQEITAARSRFPLPLLEDWEPINTNWYSKEIPSLHILSSQFQDFIPGGFMAPFLN